MPTANRAVTYFERNWLIRLFPANPSPPQRAVVFIHGWTGDEYSMDVFGKDLPETYFLMFPRGPISAQGGYGWAPVQPDSRPPMQTFEPVCRRLMQEIEVRMIETSASGLAVYLVGFSQGAAVCHTLTALFPERIQRTAILAGFLPDPGGDLKLTQVSGKSYFIAHGRNDDTIPFQVAEQNVKKLQQAGANVEFCASNSGHKLGLECLKNLREYLTR